MNWIKRQWKKLLLLLIPAALAFEILTPPPQNPNNSYDCTQPIIFTITNAQGYSFTDALIMGQEVCEDLTDQAISDLEHERFNNWIAGINAANAHFVPDIQDEDDNKLDVPNEEIP